MTIKFGKNEQMLISLTFLAFNTLTDFSYFFAKNFHENTYRRW